MLFTISVFRDWKIKKKVQHGKPCNNQNGVKYWLLGRIEKHTFAERWSSVPSSQHTSFNISLSNVGLYKSLSGRTW